MNAVKIIVSKNGNHLGEYEIDMGRKPMFIVGRGVDADIKLDDRAVGRSHALIQFASSGLSLSKKTEFGQLQLNGSEVAESVLKEGDIISIADYQLKIASTKHNESLQNQSNDSTGNKSEAVVEQPAVTDPSVQAEEPKELSADQSQSSTGQINLNSNLDSAVSNPVDAPSDVPEALPMAEPSGGEDKTSMVSASHLSVQLLFKPGEANVENYEITKEETSIGRGSSCDIVIEDKKASRKHCIIKRIGGSFVLKDLGSANGTFVNGIKVSEQELAGEDVIKIGTTEFSFIAKNQDYFAQESQGVFLKEPDTNEANANTDLANADLLPAPELSSAAESPLMPATDLNQFLPGAVAPTAPSTLNPFDGNAISTGMTVPGMISGINNAGATAPASDKKGIARIIEGFKALPTKKKIIYIVGALAIGYLLDDLSSTEPQPQQNKKQQAIQSTDPKMQSFLKLPKEKREFIEQTYTLALDYYTKGKYELAMFECDKVIEILPEGYKDILDIRAYAEQGKKQLEAQAEEEKRRKAEEERKQTIMKLVNEAQELYSKGKEAEVKEIFGRILELDPENPTVAKLKNAIEERERARQEELERLKQLEMMREAMRGVISEGKALQASGKYYEAVSVFESVKTKGSDAELLKEAKELADAAIAEMNEKRQPLIEAGFRSYDAKDYDAARASFLEALKIDPRCVECEQGLSRIRKDVHERVQRLYIEAIISESVSDLNGAKKKYLECFKASVPEDEYYGRCWRKYHRFTTVDGVEENLIDEKGNPIRAPASFLEPDMYTKEILDFL